MVAIGSKLEPDFLADFVRHATRSFKPFLDPNHDLVLLLGVSGGQETVPASQLLMAGVLDLQHGWEVGSAEGRCHLVKF